MKSKVNSIISTLWNEVRFRSTREQREIELMEENSRNLRTLPKEASLTRYCFDTTKNLCIRLTLTKSYFYDGTNLDYYRTTIDRITPIDGIFG